MVKTTIILITVLMLISQPVLATDVNISGDWVGKSFLSKISMHIEHIGQKLTGVVKIKTVLGKKNTYHFNGSIHDGKFTGYHASGHIFRGNVESQDTLSGTLTTKEGKDYDFEVRKREAREKSEPQHKPETVENYSHSR